MSRNVVCKFKTSPWSYEIFNIRCTKCSLICWMKHSIHLWSLVYTLLMTIRLTVFELLMKIFVTFYTSAYKSEKKDKKNVSEIRFREWFLFLGSWFVKANCIQTLTRWIWFPLFSEYFNNFLSVRHFKSVLLDHRIWFQ